jgi:predicted ferric reductase
MSSNAIWYAARAGGLVSYLLLSASVVLGLLMAGRARLAWPRFAVEDVHRFLSILTGVFLTVHISSILLDRVVSFGLGNVLIPFTGPYRPFATGLGVVAAELLVAVAITNALRGAIPHRWWRRAHYLTLGVWLAATVHGALAGTDRGEPWSLTLYIAAVAMVAVAGAARFRPAARLAELLLAVPAAAAVVAVIAALPQGAAR